MSTQFLLDEGDIKDLTKLMLVMIETQESRKQLCRELGINPQEVSFIIGTSDDTFCTELIDSLNRYGYQEYLCKLCCDKLYPILNKSVYNHRISILEKIIEKINCNCHHEQQNHSIPIDPHSDELKPEAWFTKIANVNKKLLAGGAILLIGLAGYILHNQTSTPSNNPFSIEQPAHVNTPSNIANSNKALTNLLPGEWEGEFNFRTSEKPIPIRVSLEINSYGSVEGAYVYSLDSGYKKGNLTGTVEGDVVRFTWTQGGDKGKGYWKYVGGKVLEGKWGKGDNEALDGIWRIEKLEQK